MAADRVGHRDQGLDQMKSNQGPGRHRVRISDCRATQGETAFGTGLDRSAVLGRFYVRNADSTLTSGPAAFGGHWFGASSVLLRHQWNREDDLHLAHRSVQPA